MLPMYVPVYSIIDQNMSKYILLPYLNINYFIYTYCSISLMLLDLQHTRSLIKAFARRLNFFDSKATD